MDSLIKGYELLARGPKSRVTACNTLHYRLVMWVYIRAFALDKRCVQSSITSFWLFCFFCFFCSLRVHFTWKQSSEILSLGIWNNCSSQYLQDVVFSTRMFISVWTPRVYFPKLTWVKSKLTGLTLVLGVGFGFGLGPGALVSAHPAPFIPDGSDIPLYIDDPAYFHKAIDTYPSLLNSAQKTFITAPLSVLPPSASISFHHSTLDPPHPDDKPEGCQHLRGSLETAQSWLRRAYQAWLKEGTWAVQI